MTFLQVGDRIELLDMPDDPDPIPVGSLGLVEHVEGWNTTGDPVQVHVKWDSGRTLSLVIPPDVVRVIEGAP